MNVLVLGAGSGVGTHLVKRLNIEDSNVFITAVCRPNSSNTERFRKIFDKVPNISTLEMDFCSINDTLGALQNLGVQDYIYILAWAGSNKASRNSMYDNMLSKTSLMRILNELLTEEKIRYGVIFLGTQAEYGIQTGCVTEKTLCEPSTAYGREKFNFGIEARKVCDNFGVNFYHFRIHSVYGKYINEEGILYSLCNALKEKGYFETETNCLQKWDYVYIDDCVEAVTLPLKRRFEPGIYNISSGNVLRMRDYFELAKQSINPKAVIIYGSKSSVEGDMEYSSKKLREEYGWRTNYSFDKGIRLLF